MAAEVLGPAWALEGIGVRSGRYPLAVEGPVMRAVDRLVPGMSTVTRYIRYHSMYAAIAAHAEREKLDVAGCRQLVRRCEVLLAASAHEADRDGESWAAHGVDRVRRFLTPGVELAGAADEEQLNSSYSPRRWGFWDQYGGPATVLGLVGVRGGVLVPGRHACPVAVQDAFAPLLSLAAQDVVSRAELDLAGQTAPGVPIAAEREWLADVVAATRTTGQVTAELDAADRTRRATLRVLGRAVDLCGHQGDGYQETLRTAVAFGPGIADDPVLGAIPETAGWRGLLLRHYSVGAWRSLWAALVAEVGSRDGEADRSAGELRDWLSRQVPDGTVRQVIAALPELLDPAGHPLPAERDIVAEYGGGPMTDVRLLLAGALRSGPGHLPDDVRAVFLGRQRRGGEFLDPTWVAALAEDYLDRPAADLAGRLVDDMLAQSRRVALAKLRRDPATGVVQIFSRLHVRNERYFKTGDEGETNIGTRIPQIGFFAQQLDLFTAVDGQLAVTPAGRSALEITG